jgi:hypothetical protein
MLNAKFDLNRHRDAQDNKPMKKRKKATSNKRNLLYFEATSMSKLHGALNAWQEKNNKRFLSLSIQREGDLICCIALTNPSEVIIMDGYSDDGVDVRDCALKVFHG